MTVKDGFSVLPISGGGLSSSLPTLGDCTMMVAETGALAVTNCTIDETICCFSFCQKAGTTSSAWDKFILLDNETTCHIFKKWALLTNLQKANHTINICSTVGFDYTDTMGYIANFPDLIWLCKVGLANILSFAKVCVAGCQISVYLASDTFTVCRPTKVLVFSQTAEGLYAH